MTLACKVVIIRGNAYDTLPPEQKTLIQPLENFKSLDTRKIYELTAQQLSYELEKHPKSLVYVFKSGCTSDNCLPLITVENYAIQHQLKLFLVLVGFSDLQETLAQKPSVQLFAINAQHYGNPKNSKYIHVFLNELGYEQLVSTGKIQGNYLFFEGAKMVEVKERL